MIWTEKRARKVVAIIDGIMTLLFVWSAYGQVYHLTGWIHSSINHGDWPKVGDQLLSLPWSFTVLEALFPDSWGMLFPLLLVPVAMGFHSYAVSEPLVTKFFRWLLISSVFAITVAMLPLLSLHLCMCGHEEAYCPWWIQILWATGSVMFLRHAKRLARLADATLATPEATPSDAPTPG